MKYLPFYIAFSIIWVMLLLGAGKADAFNGISFKKVPRPLIYLAFVSSAFFAYIIGESSGTFEKFLTSPSFGSFMDNILPIIGFFGLIMYFLALSAFYILAPVIVKKNYEIEAELGKHYASGHKNRVYHIAFNGDDTAYETSWSTFGKLKNNLGGIYRYYKHECVWGVTYISGLKLIDDSGSMPSAYTRNQPTKKEAMKLIIKIWLVTMAVTAVILLGGLAMIVFFSRTN